MEGLFDIVKGDEYGNKILHQYSGLAIAELWDYQSMPKWQNKATCTILLPIRQ